MGGVGVSLLMKLLNWVSMMPPAKSFVTSRASSASSSTTGASSLEAIEDEASRSSWFSAESSEDAL